MTLTQIARRSDALYEDSTGAMTRRVLCDMVAQRESDLEDARAENDKLRDGAYAMRQLYEDELKHALAENAKLRELVQYMWDFSCVLPDEPYTSKEELAYSVEVWKRMRELGVEVDG